MIRGGKSTACHTNCLSQDTAWKLWITWWPFDQSVLTNQPTHQKPLSDMFAWSNCCYRERIHFISRFISGSTLRMDPANGGGFPWNISSAGENLHTWELRSRDSNAFQEIQQDVSWQREALFPFWSSPSSASMWPTLVSPMQRPRKDKAWMLPECFDTFKLEILDWNDFPF